MRRGWLVILFVIVLLSINQARALAIYEASPYVYRLKVAQCSEEPQARVLTGFRVMGIDGIVTALHGVAGCELITARSDDKNSDNIFRNLVIQEVDIERDVALLWSDDMASAPPGGLEAASPVDPEGDLRVMGYPKGLSSQRPLVNVAFLGHRKLAERIPDNDPSKQVLDKRQSPSLAITVIDLQASLVPGHSGAPVLTVAGQVYGVANGGLDQGATEFSWAIPWHEIEWHPVEEERARLTRLALNHPLSDLSFSSTFPDYETVELAMQSLPTEAVRSYRAFSFMYMSGRAGDQDVEAWLGFETSYNEAGNQRSLIGIDYIQVFGQGQGQDYTEEQAFLIFSNQDHYLRLAEFQDECLQLDELPELTGTLVEQTDEMVSIPIEEQDLTLAAYLGVEEINGLNTDHYLLLESIPLEVTETGSPISEIIGAEIWVTVAGNQLRKISYEVASYEDSSISDQPFIGYMYVEIEYSDINTDVTVDLPLACQNASLASSSPQSAPGNGWAMITEPIPVEHNVSGPQGASMVIQPTFRVDNLAEMPGLAIVRIFSEDGLPLPAYSPETGALDGIYQAWTDFTPPYEQTIFEELEIIVPYSDLSLADGVHNLKFRVFVYDISTETVLAASDFYDFGLRQQTDVDGYSHWFGGEFSELSGVTVAGQTDVSPLAQDVGNFLSQAFEEETWAYWYQDLSVAEPYFGGQALLDLQEGIEYLQEQGLVMAAEFDEQRSFIVNISLIDDNTVEVNVCESWAAIVIDQSEQPVYEQPPSLIPLTVTLEQPTGSWWLITDSVENPDGLSCELE